MSNLVRHPFIALPMKFLARITMGALWGIALSPFALEVKVGFGAMLAVLGLLLSYAFVAWDRLPVSASRLALYGLLVAGEALGVGCIVLGALGAFTGQLETIPMMLCGFGGTVLTLYPLSVLYKDNMAKGAGSNP